MSTNRSNGAADASLTRNILNLAWYYLGNRRGLFIFAGLAIAASLAFNWSWLLAVGIAPILVSVLPCLAMCALGLCMKKAGGKSCVSRNDAPETPPIHLTSTPASRTTVPNASTALRIEQDAANAVSTRMKNIEPQSPQKRSTTDA